jgi:V/A-type H+-transporting ATPase subunit E
MGTQDIVERILFDARSEAAAIIEDAENKAAKTLAEASARAESFRQQTENEVAQKRKSIMEKRAADARLDGAKLLLKEKRKVVDTVYEAALARLLKLPKETSIKLVSSLLETYAEEGDEIYFARNFSYAEDIKILPVIARKKLSIAQETLSIDGGLRLKGKLADKDLSFGALLAMDRESNQADLAKKIFK